MRGPRPPRLVVVSLVSLLPLLVVAQGCGDAAEAGAMMPDDWTDGDMDHADTQDGSAGADREDPASEPDPEPIRLSLPVQGERKVFFVQENRRQAVMIDAFDLGIRSVPLGRGPYTLVTLPGRDVALVLSAGSDEVSLVDGIAATVRSWNVSSQRKGYNALCVAPDGRHAIAYFDDRRPSADGSVLGSLQDVALIDLTDIDGVSEDDMPVRIVGVGFHPTGCAFTSDSARVFVITDRGLTLLDLGNAANSVPLIPLEESTRDPRDREVAITPDGRHAVVRRFDSDRLTLVDLVTRERHERVLDAQATDLDLIDGGRLALVVLRDAKRVVLYAVPGDFTDPDAEPVGFDVPETVGLAEPVPDLPGGETDRRFLLYSTGTELEYLYVFDRVAGTFARRSLEKGIRMVAPAPSGTRALVLHSRKPGTPTGDLYDRVDKSEGYSLVSLEEDTAVLQLTPQAQGDFVFTPDGAKVYLLVPTTTGRGDVHVGDLSDPVGGRVSTIPLASGPVAVGVIPGARRAYVAQDHPEGRVTFGHIDTDETRTITGFERNGRVE